MKPSTLAMMLIALASPLLAQPVEHDIDEYVLAARVVAHIGIPMQVNSHTTTAATTASAAPSPHHAHPRNYGDLDQGPNVLHDLAARFMTKIGTPMQNNKGSGSSQSTAMRTTTTRSISKTTTSHSASSTAVKVVQMHADNNGKLHG